MKIVDWRQSNSVKEETFYGVLRELKFLGRQFSQLEPQGDLTQTRSLIRRVCLCMVGQRPVVAESKTKGIEWTRMGKIFC